MLLMHASTCRDAQTSRRAHAKYICTCLCNSQAFYWLKRSLLNHLYYFSLDQQKYWYNHILLLSGKGHGHHGDLQNKSTWAPLLRYTQCVNNFSVYNCSWRILGQTHISLYVYVGHSVATNTPQHPLSNPFKFWLAWFIWLFSGFSSYSNVLYFC